MSDTTTPTQQLQLPYAEITKVANREFLRKNKETFTQTPRASFKMPLSKIHERDGFNSRIVYEGIEELAEDIFLRGLDEPMVLDIMDDGIGFIDEGHRRFKALMLLCSQEKIDKEYLVEFYPNKASVTELDRMVRQITSNVNLKKDLKVYEKAKVAWNVKNLYSENPLSHEEVGRLLHISRQTIDNLIKIAEADDALKNTMVEKDLNLKDCLALVKEQAILKKQTDKVEEDSHKNTAPPTAFPKDSLADEKKELEELEKPTDGELWWSSLLPGERVSRMAEYYGDDSANDEPHKEQIEEMYSSVQAEKELAELLEVSDEVKVREETLIEHIGKKLSADVVKEWTTEVNDGQGEPETKDMEEVLVTKNTILTEEIAKQIIDTGVIDSIFLYKVGMAPIAASVITEPVAEKEKDKWDMDRPEIAQIQNIIKLADKIEAVVNKLDCPDQTKLDLANYVKWLQTDAAEVRQWIHTNKKQNKIR